MNNDNYEQHNAGPLCVNPYSRPLSPGLSIVAQAGLSIVALAARWGLPPGCWLRGFHPRGKQADGVTGLVERYKNHSSGQVESVQLQLNPQPSQANAATTQTRQPTMSSGNSMSRITFYEEKNFQGRSYECSSDCADMSSYLSRCHSCRVERGCFMVYDRSNYMGNQFFMRRGEYSDYMSMMGMSDCIRSVRMIPMVSTPLS